MIKVIQKETIFMMKKTNWEDIYRQEAPKLLAVCRRYVNDLQTAEDLMHDGFMTAIRKQQQFSGKGAIGAWLRRITVNTVLMYLRKQKRLNELLQADAPLVVYHPDEPEPQTAKEIIKATNFEVADLLEVIDQLPAHHKVVFNLYVFENYSHKQIAEQLSISPGTSKSHLARARKSIQKILLEKAKNMKKKRRRAILFFFSTKKEEGAYVDELFQSKMEEETIQPSGMPDALRQSMQTAPPIQSTSMLAVIKSNLGIGLSMIALVSVSSWMFFAPSDAEQQATTHTEQQENPVPIEISNTTMVVDGSKEAIDSAVFIKKESTTKKEVLPQTVKNKPPKTKKSKTKTKKAKKNMLQKTPSKTSSKPPVVVRKKVIVRDTVYQKIDKNEK